MKTQRTFFHRCLSGIALLMSTLSASAHIGYSGRDFGTVVPNAAPVTLSNQTVTGNYGWADGTDADFGDSHKVRAFRFSLAAPAYVTITFSGSTNGDTRDGSLKPGFSVYQGLAHLAPITNAPGSADHDFSAISQAYLATLDGGAKEGTFRAMADWRVGGDNQTGPEFDFEAADGLSTFVFQGYAADGDASLFGPTGGITGDGNADGTVTQSFYLPAGDFSIFVGGVKYGGQFPTPDATSYGITGSISASAFTYVEGDPAEGGIGYHHQVTLGSKSAGSFSGLVGSWSWEDEGVFDEGETTKGWTHTSNWVALRLTTDSIVKVTMERDANVPWPSLEEPDRKADTSAMYPSFTLYRGWDNDGEDSHTYENRENISWAEDTEYVDHVDNSTEETVTRSFFLRAGDYTLALGSNAPSVDRATDQGYKISFETETLASVDPVPNTYPEPDYIGTGGVGYAHTVIAGLNESDSFRGTVGAWSWEDNRLFSPGQPPVGWTHTSNWVAVKLTHDAYFSLTVERDATVPARTLEDPEAVADTSSMFPSFTLYRGWDNDGSDDHTYNNRGNVTWAEDLRYVDHVDNSTSEKVTRTWYLPAGEYSLAIGSNASSDNPLDQGYKATYSTRPVGSVVGVDPSSGGIGYSRVLTVGRGDSGSFSDHVGGWSWEDSRLFDSGEGETPVGWTHQSRWLAVYVKDSLTLNLTLSRDANVPWPSTDSPDRKAAIDSMFPSFTIWRGWDNDGSDNHSYNNRGNVDWAEDLSYLDHYDNSSQESITRSYTLAPGYYTIVVGSNAPATEAPGDRQGFNVAWTTGSPSLVPPVIGQQPKSASSVAGGTVTMQVKAAGPNLSYQWFHDDRVVSDAVTGKLTIENVSPEDAGDYHVVARNAAGWVTSETAQVEVISIPEVAAFDIPNLKLGQYVEVGITASNNPLKFNVKGLPKGLKFDAKTRLISGRPTTVSPLVMVEVTAANKAGTSEVETDGFSITALDSGISGSFTGPLGRAVAINDYLGGKVQFQVTSLGGLSGTITLGKKSYKVAALLDTSLAAPTASLSIVRKGQPDLQVSLMVTAEAKAISGELTDGTTVLPFVARQPLSSAGDYEGDYTMALLVDELSVGDDFVPQGASVGAFKVVSKGSASGVILLADNTKVTFGGPLENNGYLTVFNVLYKGVGSLLGAVSIDAPAESGNLVQSEFSWFKGEVIKDRAYGDGFGPLDLLVIGRKYAAPAAGALPLNAEEGPGNASLTFTEGGAPAPETRLGTSSVELGLKTTKVAEPNPGKIKLSVVAGVPGKFKPGSSATFKGSFELTDSDTSISPSKDVIRKATFQGMLIDDGESVKGYGFFLLPQMPTASPKTTVKTSPILSGQVMLEAVPNNE